MHLAAMFSGGKDSTYAAYLAEQNGYDISMLFSMYPNRSDSWMFHSVNIHLTRLLAQALEKPLLEVPTLGEKERELDDLQLALKQIPVEGIVTGAIASNYQRERFDKICKALDIQHIKPLWGIDQKKILKAEIESGMDIIFSSVAAEGLNKSWLGRHFDMEIIEELQNLNRTYGVNISGEGGEYESLVLDAPWLKKRIVIDECESSWNGFSGEFRVKRAHLAHKS